MPINFPDSPTTGDTHTVGDKTWTYDGTAWNVVQNNIADHGNLGGLGDDDHTQYALADGSRGTFETSGAVSTHEAASDPHTQYLLADGTRSATGTITATGFSGPLTGNVTGDVSGSAATANALSTSRTISLTGDVTGSTSFDGSANVSLATSLAAATGKLVKSQYYSNSTIIYSAGSWTTFLSGSYTPLSASNTLVIIATPVVSMYDAEIEFYAAGSRIASFDRQVTDDFSTAVSFHPPYLYSTNAGSTSARTYEFQFFSGYANADNNVSALTSSMLILEIAP